MQLQKSIFMASVDLTVCEHTSTALQSLTGNLPRRETGGVLSAAETPQAVVTQPLFLKVMIA